MVGKQLSRVLNDLLVTWRMINDWAESALARVENEDDIGVSCSSPCCCLYSHANTAAFESREVAVNVWTDLKTLLFTTTMLLRSILSIITYSRPVASSKFK